MTGDERFPAPKTIDAGPGRPMLVGLNLLYLLPGIVGGTETYAAGLLEGFAGLDAPVRLVVYVNREAAEWPLPADPRIRRAVCPVNATSRVARYAHEQFRLPGRVAADGVDLVHSLGYVAPLRLARPSVVTVHDVHHLAHGRPHDWMRRRLLGLIVGQSVRRAAAVITDSGFARDQIVRAYGVAPTAVDVVPLAPNPRHDAGSPDGQASEWPESEPFLVAFGGVTPNKNLPRLFQAFALARARFGLTHRLLVVGRLPPSVQAANAPGVTLTGYLEDSRLAAALGAADALVFPSTYEGFGLPVLEAMAKGLPVVCSRAAAMPEVGGDAVIYFDPLEVEDMASKIALVAGDAALRRDLSARGRRRAREFTWERAAQATLAVYRRILSR